jgi:peptide/nickel transport system permease protein
MADTTSSGDIGGRKRRIKLGFGFWLPMSWVIFLFFCAATADFWPLPLPSEMHFLDQEMTPGHQSMAFINEEEVEFTFVLGTDNMGRDILARLIHGSRVSLMVGLVSPIIGLVIGGLLGMLAGYFRGRIEGIVVAVMDAVLAFPALVLLIALTFYLGPSLTTVTFSLGILTVPFFTRVARASTLTFAKREFVLAARAIGTSDFRIIVREILPNVFFPLLVYALLVTAALIIAEGVLGFLGLSVPPPTTSWGAMINDGRDYLEEAPHISLIPAAAMFLTVLSFNLLGDYIRSLGDPRESKL